jgi:hypothetical protein
MRNRFRNYTAGMTGRGTNKHPWTLAQGFYAAMGGFVLETPGAFHGILPEARVTWNLRLFDLFLSHFRMPIEYCRPTRYQKLNTGEVDVLQSQPLEGNMVKPSPSNADINQKQPQLHQDQEDSYELKQDPESDLVQLESHSEANLRDILDISPEEVLSKSKASGLAKGIVCLQAIWFCIQCLSRVSQSLPITLFELNTVAHSICALLVYLLWWEKPLDVQQVISIPIRDTTALSAWALVNQGSSFEYLSQTPESPIKLALTGIQSWLHLGPSQSTDYSGELRTQNDGQPVSRYDFPPTE